jgi:polyhydroxyalkanoate synthase
MHLRNGWMPWSEDLAEAGRELGNDLAKVDPQTFGPALLAELTESHAQFLSGLEAYRTHPYRRTLTTPPPLWEKNGISLLDYGALAQAPRPQRPVLVVPSLVNRFYIMDLMENGSFLRFLASRGFRPLLIDWGDTGADTGDRTLDWYIGEILSEALGEATDVNNGNPVPVIGYCMGGTLAAALTVLRPKQISALVLLATPWDFHCDHDGPHPGIVAARRALEALISNYGLLPVDALQSMFFSLDPLLGWRKFRAFSRLKPNSAKARAFVALEDWLNDGTPLTAPVARGCLFGWYLDNEPARGDWTVAGSEIDASTIQCPVLAAIPRRDRIVSPASARALIDAIPGGEWISPDTGHIGMMVGGSAKEKLWEPMCGWLETA